MSEPIKIETPLGRFWTRPNDFVTRQLRECGGHQRSDIGMISSLLREGDVVFDVGAHIGTVCIPLASKIGGSGRLYAFEPVRESFQILARNLRENDVLDRVVAMNAVVSDRDDSYQVELPEDHTSAAHFVRRAPGAEASGDAVETLHLGEWATRPDVALQSLDLMKVDTEGMELRVLESAATLIERFRPIIVAEMSAAFLQRAGDTVLEVERFLRGFGYHFFRNTVSRHATDESFELIRMLSPRHCEDLYDLVAIQPGSDRYPTSTRSPIGPLLAWWLGRVRRAPAGLLRRLRG